VNRRRERQLELRVAPAVALLAGGTICYEMLTHFKNRTAAISWGLIARWLGYNGTMFKSIGQVSPIFF
jgi:hypothetical protein